MDQADRLRNIVKERSQQENTQKEWQEPVSSISSRVIAITSGKGGVGKTNFTINLAIQLSRHNKKVVIIDADFGLANIEVLCGVIPKYNFSDIISGEKTIDQVMTSGPLGIKFLSGGSGLGGLANMSDEQISHITDNFAYLDSVSDVILIDTSAGISKTVMNLIGAAEETIIVTTPEPTSITDAYAVIKVSQEEGTTASQFKVVVNRVDNYREGLEIFENLNRVTERFLGIKLQSLGTIPYDSQLVKAVKKQQPVCLCFPDSESARSIENISYRLMNMEVKNRPEGVGSFMKRLIKVFSR